MLDVFTIYCLDLDTPVVKHSPASPKINEQLTLTCDAATTDTGSKYQWLFGDNVVPGEITKTYTITSTAKSNAGSYSCKVTTDNIPEKTSSKVDVIVLCKF